MSELVKGIAWMVGAVLAAFGAFFVVLVLCVSFNAHVEGVAKRVSRDQMKLVGVTVLTDDPETDGPIAAIESGSPFAPAEPYYGPADVRPSLPQTFAEIYPYPTQADIGPPTAADMLPPPMNPDGTHNEPGYWRDVSPGVMEWMQAPPPVGAEGPGHWEWVPEA